MVEKQRRGLGRGLGALIPTDEHESDTSDQASSQKITQSRPVDLFFPDKVSESRVRKEGSRGRAQTGANKRRDAQAQEQVSRETSSEAALTAVPGARFAQVSIQDIRPNKKQPRSVFDEADMNELIHSIKEVGLLQPIVVRPTDVTAPGQPHYELVMGERRWRAARAAGLDAIPAIVRATEDVDLLRDALLENLHRSQLNPLEEAAAYQQLLEEFNTTHDELADRIGRSRSQVTNMIRLLRLPPKVQRSVSAGVLTAGHARALLGLPNQEAMERLADRIVSEGLSVRSTEEAVSLYSDEPVTTPRAAKQSQRHERLDFLADSLADRLDTTVKITLGAKKGKVSIDFASVEDLNRIMALIGPSA